MTPSQPAPSECLRPVTWPIWLAWVVAAALGPVFSTIAATAIEKPVLHNVQPRALIVAGLFALTSFAILAPPIMQGLVLKRIVPKLSVGFWFFCIVVSGIAWFTLTQSRDHGPALIEAGFRAQFQLQSAALARRMDGTLSAAHIVNLPWGPFLLWTIATSALTAVIPAWALGWASGRQRAALLFFAAAIAAACASGVVEQIYNITVDYLPFNTWALNGQSWTQRFQALAIRSGAGAAWGSVTAIAVLLMTRSPEATTVANTSRFATHRPGGLALLLIAPLLIALLAPLAGYLAGPRGLVAGAPELRKALSLAPSQDRSQGEMVLSYSHDVAVPVARAAGAMIAPDGRSAIVRAADHTLVQVDLASGRSLRQLGPPLAPSEQYALAWSTDGRTLALRSNGTEVTIPNTHYRRYQSRVRLYALPDLTLTGEFSNSEGDCFDANAREPMLFSSDSKSLWLVCGQYTAPKPDDLMAIRLDVSAVQALDIRHYGQGAESGQIRGLERIGDSVWAWQFPYGGKPFRVYDLTHARDIVMVPLPAEVIGRLTEQTGQSQLDEQTIRLNFCGTPPGAPANAGPASWICRMLTFDTRTGILIGSVDKADHRTPNPPSDRPKAILYGHSLRIESFWQDDRKTGELVIRDSVTGRERQRIVSIAQRPLQMSGDGGWLMTASVDGSRLRLYRTTL
jgi:hypothetical protein